MATYFMQGPTHAEKRGLEIHAGEGFLLDDQRSVKRQHRAEMNLSNASPCARTFGQIVDQTIPFPSVPAPMAATAAVVMPPGMAMSAHADHHHTVAATAAARPARTVNEALMARRPLAAQPANPAAPMQPVATWGGLQVTMGAQPLPLGAQQCYICRKMAGPASLRGTPQGHLCGSECAHCGRFVCPCCSSRCGRCEGDFCRLCSAVSYAGRYEEIVCGNCHASLGVDARAETTTRRDAMED